MTPLESTLRRLASSLDDAALEALASKGLLRRAQKDRERAVPVNVLGEEPGVLRVQVGDATVALPGSGPATARCSCPAGGICQHILGAVLFLRQDAGAETTTAASPPPSCEAGLLPLTREQLEQWAGKAAFRAGCELASRGGLEVERERGLQVRLPSLNLECHFIAGGGLEGAIVSGGRHDPRAVVVASVIALQRAAGQEWQFARADDALEAALGAPRTRAEVLVACQTLLAESLAIGLARLSAAHQQRWATLAVSALGVQLPRLALAVRGLADETALAVARDARADLARLFQRMAHAHALCAALASGGDHPRPDLVGQHRTHYDEVGSLDLVGVAAWPWRTASGYEGLTLLFWDAAAKRWNSWSESRPKHQLAGFNPVARYTQFGPWEGAASPRQLASSSFRLLNARRNPGFRLSSSGRSRVLVTGATPSCPDGLPVFTEWEPLTEHLAKHRSAGLKEADPLDAIVALRPAIWGGRAFDSVQQVFGWLLLDATGESLLLKLAFDDLSEPAIRFLESVPLETLRNAVVIGRAQATPHGIHFQPHSLHRPQAGITHLALDQPQPAAPSSNVSAPVEEDELVAVEDGDETLTPPCPAVVKLLNELDDALLAWAESGLDGSNGMRSERVRQLAATAQRLGLNLLGAHVSALGSRAPDAAALLRCDYVGQLHRQGQI